MDLNWTDNQMQLAQKTLIERFAQNCVSGHLAPNSVIDEKETTVATNRFDFAQAIVVDREVYGLYEPFSFCTFTKAQVDEFHAVPDGGDASQTKVVTTLVRAASSLARWHDVLFFVGLAGNLPPPAVMMPAPNNPPQSLREAALAAEGELGGGPIPVNGPNINEGLVAAVYAGVLELENRGYFAAYNLVLGQDLWQALHQPSAGSMVLPRDRVESTLAGGAFYRTTTLPANEALLASSDGKTFDCVVAGDPAQSPRFEWLRIETSAATGEQLYLFRARELFAPRPRENRAVVRLAA